MSERNDGGPAFPITTQSITTDGVRPPLESALHGPSGMSPRDWFAGQASGEMVRHFCEQYMEVLRTNEPDSWKEPLTYSDFHCAKMAMIEARYRMAVADAMLAERAKVKP